MLPSNKEAMSYVINVYRKVFLLVVYVMAVILVNVVIVRHVKRHDVMLNHPNDVTTMSPAKKASTPPRSASWERGRLLPLRLYHAGLGRFGNLLFEYSSVQGIAADTGRVPHFSRTMSRLPLVFPNLNLHTLAATPTWNKMADNLTYDFDEKFLDLPKVDLILEGHFASFRYFEKISQRLYQEIFSNMNPLLVEKAQEFLRGAKEKYKSKNKGVTPKTVCVHIRRGDKAFKKAQGWGYRVADASDIIKAMDYMKLRHKQRHNDVVFITSSDSKDWCVDNIEKQRRNVYVSILTSLYEDFVLMSSCDDVIMTVGTFGWWAAWLTSQRGGDVMYYAHPFVTGSHLDRLLDRKDHFLPTWIAYNITHVIDKHVTSPTKA